MLNTNEIKCFSVFSSLLFIHNNDDDDDDDDNFIKVSRVSS